MVKTEQGIAPGSLIHYNQPFYDYCKLPGLNPSALKGDGRHSAKHLDAYIRGLIKTADSPSMRFGRALHSMILEPDKFEDTFPKATPCAAVLKSGDNKGKLCGCSASAINNGLWYCGKHATEDCKEPYDYVTSEEMTRLNDLRESVKASNANDYLRRGDAFSEVVIQWKQWSVELKTRIDRLSVEKDRITLVDVKTCSLGGATYEESQRACWNYRYFIAAVMHYAAVRAVFGDSIEIESYFLFCESVAPYDTFLLRVSDQDLEIAQANVISQLSRYVRCKRLGKFDGCQPIIDPEKSGMLPSWVVKQYLKGG